MAAPGGEGPGFWGKLANSMFEYQTLKIVNIGNKKIGVLNRIIQIGILAYIVGYVIVYQKGYQHFSPYNAATTSKVKGVISTLDLNDTDFVQEVPNKDAYKRIWDISDLVVPPTETDAFFLTTNIIITSQKREKCPEDPTTPNVACKDDTECVKGQANMLGNGVETGRCVPLSNKPNSSKVCEIDGWCPAEVDKGPLLDREPLFAGIVNFTVLLKNYVEFPLFALKLRNIQDSETSKYLSGCTYNPHTDKFCPVFRVGDILKLAGIDMDHIGIKGGVIRIVVDWDCNLDFDLSYCRPTYKFLRIDDPQAKVAKGWNFRYANNYGNGTRTLYKAYGITFRVTTSAKAGKFYMVNVAVNIGSGLGLLALATIVCDLVVLNCVKKREVYKRNKFRFVDDYTPEFDDASVNYESPHPKASRASNYEGSLLHGLMHATVQPPKKQAQSVNNGNFLQRHPETMDHNSCFYFTTGGRQYLVC